MKTVYPYDFGRNETYRKMFIWVFFIPSSDNLIYVPNTVLNLYLCFKILNDTLLLRMQLTHIFHV